MPTKTTTPEVDQVAAPQRPVRSNVKLNFGSMITLVVDLVPQGRPNREKEIGASLFADVDGTLVAPKRMFVALDEAGTQVAGPWKEGELVSGREQADGSIVTFADDELALAKVGDLEPGVCNLSLCPTDQVTTKTRPSGTGYRLRPGKTASHADRQMYSAVRELVEAKPAKGQPPASYVGELRTQFGRALYRLDVWQGQLYLEQLTHPADLAAPDVIDCEPMTKTELTKALATLRSQVELVDFDPAAFRHDAAAAINDLIAAKVKAGPTKATPKVTEEGILDLLARSVADVEQAKGRHPSKPARKRKTAA